MYKEFLLNRAARMFSMSGLPPDIDEQSLMLTKIIFGSVALYQSGDAFHLYRGYPGGEMGENFAPARYIGTNPGVTPSSIDKVTGVEVAVFFNGTLEKFGGMLFNPDLIPKKKKEVIARLPFTPLYRYIQRTAEQLEHIDISVKSLLRTSRASFFISAIDGQSKAAAETAINRILDGDPATIFLSGLLDNVKFDFAPTASNAAGLLQELREQYQFTLAQYYHAIGINANYNLKRERLNSAEIDVNRPALLVNVADMEKCMQEGAEQARKVYGLDISVKLAEEWQPPKEDTENEKSNADTSGVERKANYARNAMDSST